MRQHRAVCRAWNQNKRESQEAERQIGIPRDSVHARKGMDALDYELPRAVRRALYAHQNSIL